MEAIWQWGLDLIRAIQLIDGPVLNAIFKFITLIGDEEFFFILFPLLFWCVNFSLGVRLITALLISAHVNFWLKDLIAHPRPFQLDPTVKLHDALGYGFPSAHAQLAVVVWGIIAAWLHKTWPWIIAVLLMVLIGFSRIYLGVHFPTDVLGGWIIGAIFLTVYLTLGTRAETWLKQASLPVQLALAVAVPMVLLLSHPTNNTANPMAVLMGGSVGIVLGRRTIYFKATGPLWQRGARFLVGGIALFVLYFGLRLVFPVEGESFYFTMRVVRYALIGLWITLGAPWLFLQMRLASNNNHKKL